MINARAETVAEKPSYRTAFQKRRCLIPATGFFEWKRVNGGKQPYNIHIGEGNLFASPGCGNTGRAETEKSWSHAPSS